MKPTSLVCFGTLLVFALSVVFEPFNMTSPDGDMLCAKYYSNGVISRFPNPDSKCDNWFLHESVHGVFSNFSVKLKERVIGLWLSEELFVLHYEFNDYGVHLDI